MYILSVFGKFIFLCVKLKKNCDFIQNSDTLILITGASFYINEYEASENCNVIK